MTPDEQAVDDAIRALIRGDIFVPVGAAIDGWGRLKREYVTLRADLQASKFAEREWHDKALDLLAEREAAL